MEIHNVQQGTQEWRKLRLGRVTGTRLKQVMGVASKSLVFEMIAEKYEDAIAYTSDEMNVGTLREGWAIADYEKATGQIVSECGFVTEGEDLGLSPDGLVGEKKALEIKSPALKKHLEYLLSDKLPAEYKWQVVHYFIVMPHLETVDFVTYNPNFEPKQIHIIPVNRADVADDILKAQEKLAKFLEEYNQTLLKLL